MNNYLIAAIIILWLLPVCLNAYYCLEYYLTLPAWELKPDFDDYLMSAACVLCPAVNLAIAVALVVEIVKEPKAEVTK